MNDDIEKVDPFDSFSVVNKILGWVGYYRYLNNPTGGYKWIFYQIYKSMALLVVIFYNIQHIIFGVENYNDSNKFMDCLMIEIPQLNLLMKVATVYVQKSRLDRLNRFLKEDTTFRALDEEGQSILRENKKEMNRLCRWLMINVTVAAVFWPSSYFVRRYNDPNETVPSYIPFAVDSWAKFSLTVLLESGPIQWIGHGHLAIDTLILTYYAHAEAQVKIIKQQLEQLAGTDGERTYLKSFPYRDLYDGNIGKRFVLIVKRYEKLIWYINEIDSIFNLPLSFQFLSSAASVCFVIYQMSVISVTSFPFLFLVILFIILLTQIFLYCYFGNRLEYESRSLCNSLYNSNWVTLSPSFRRQMLIPMVRWSQPIQPIVCYTIPLSLNTFITIVKSSYTLYTVLITAKFNDAA